MSERPIIGERDIQRLLIEFSHEQTDSVAWALANGIDFEGLFNTAGGFAKTLWERYEAYDDDGTDAREALEYTISTFLACFAIAFELGRQYPAHPFE